MDPLDWVDEQLMALERENLLRALPPAFDRQGAMVEVEGRPLVNFASNDYLALAANERLVRAAVAACHEQGVGRGASPLVCGRATAHAALEDRLAQFFGTEAALLFPTSFAANAGSIPALVAPGDAVYGDRHNHASIIDGCRLSGAEKFIYPHCDADALEAQLAEGTRFRRRLIVTDALFSMDGDLAPLPRLAELARRYEAMLLVDETHAVGVFGATGRGVVELFSAEHPEIERGVSLRVGTFGKALGVAGGFVCGRRALVQWLANRARTYVFSTAHPAALSAAGLAALEIVAANPERGSELLARADRLRARLRQLGWDTGDSTSQIIPLVIGSAEETMRISATLRERGYWVPGIRPPSVPPERSLLRLGLTLGHTVEITDGLLTALQEISATAR